jgi:hypothetical protein
MEDRASFPAEDRCTPAGQGITLEAGSLVLELETGRVARSLPVGCDIPVLCFPWLLVEAAPCLRTGRFNFGVSKSYFKSLHKSPSGSSPRPAWQEPVRKWGAVCLLLPWAPALEASALL